MIAARASEGRRFRAAIVGWGRYLPDRVVSNDELAARVGTTAEWIEQKIGVQERRFAADGEEQWMMGAHAARRALDSAGLAPEELDLLVVTTNVPDHPIPSTSVLIQEAIGAENVGAFDIIGGCPSFAAAVSVISSMIESGTKRHVLLVAAEKLSVLVDFKTKGMSCILGDGAGALVFAPADDGTGVLGTHYRSVGAHWRSICMPAGGTALRPTADNVLNDGHVIHMDGRAVKDLVAQYFTAAVAQPLAAADLALADVDLLVPHQANLRLIDDAVRELGFPRHKTFTNLERYGNLSSASVPVALSEAADLGLLKANMIVAAPVYGAGFSYGGTVIRWGAPLGRAVIPYRAEASRGAASDVLTTI